MGYDGLATALAADDRFRQAADGLTGAVVFDVDGAAIRLAFTDGVIEETRESFRFSNWDVALRWDASTWRQYRDPDPPPYHQDLRSSWIAEGLELEGDLTLALRYWPAMKRLANIAAARWDDD
ncbi:MAG: hypothetical protein ABEH64_02465 [Salinirussus sp.]